ncbi:hypothetical protein GUITHDRAFT_66600 [Guillardia theta CCMP2712]|uniref:Sugar phosphate transporter domain-containing protein n=2 Tax=Guillardia theta TaxID=55529 RepID=L1JRN3_GUITC|nr:hypothetical protein GUITHDRAFT_66600 [Guillardia theta CCMP2712]EKX50954.1 hypothetical protein GUITHDRAFT_66600 [Guillardia theta CCMP2712]|eukprot:XP_005837934.1 hypothetical protein GUITHDRAFT_66600 [Guillardia theta CCMP2712]
MARISLTHRHRSLSLTLLNKLIFSRFKYPLFVTEFQLVVAMALLYILGEVSTKLGVLTFIPPVDLDGAIAMKILPVTLLFVSMLSSTNYCLKHVDISFYQQILRSLVIPFNILISYLLLGVLPSFNASTCSIVVMVGFALGTVTELNFSHEGFIFGIFSSIMVACYSTSVKKILPVVGNSTWRLMHYTTFLGILALAPMVYISGELKGALSSGAMESRMFWLMMTNAAVVGFLINLAYFALIKYGSPLTTHISGCAKTALQTVLSVIIFGNRVSFWNSVGIAITLLGSSAYSLERFLEVRQKKP